MKFTLSNAPDNTSLERLIFMQAQRYWIERSFQDAKVECGLGEYQARKWRSWASPYGNGHDGNAVFARATPFI